MYNLLKIAQTEDKEAIHYCDYHLLSLAIAVVTVTFVLIIFTLFCYAVLWFIHDKMENSEKFKDYVIESEIDRRKSPAGIMGRWWTGTCFMLQFTYCGLTDISVSSRHPPVYGDLTCHFIWIFRYMFVIQCFIRVFSALCLLNNLRGATSKHNVRATFYLRMLGGYIIKNIDLNL